MLLQKIADCPGSALTIQEMQRAPNEMKSVVACWEITAVSGVPGVRYTAFPVPFSGDLQLLCLLFPSPLWFCNSDNLLLKMVLLSPKHKVAQQ